MLFLTCTKAIHGLTLFLLLVILICDSPEILRQGDLNQRRWALCNFKHQLCDALIWGETSGKSYIRVSLSLSVSSWRRRGSWVGGESAKHLVLLSREMRRSWRMNFLLANVQPSGSYIRAETWFPGNWQLCLLFLPPRWLYWNRNSKSLRRNSQDGKHKYKVIFGRNLAY